MQLFLQTCTPNLDKSISYFEALDFDIEKREGNTLVFDSQLKIILDHKNTARTGLTFKNFYAD